MLIRILAIILAPLAVAALVVGQAQARWRAASEELRHRLAITIPSASPAYSATELVGLPTPVARYFRSVLRDGQAIIRQASVTWSGQFNMGQPGRDRWVPFTATQAFAPATRGFVWDARMAMAPGLPVLVCDAFVDGVGSMHGAILGLVRVVDVEGTPGIARSALLRFLGEAVWLPTALLPSQGVDWTAIDDANARATISAGDATVSAHYHFGEDGLIASMSSQERVFDDGKNPPIRRPWGGWYRHYEARNGTKVPTESEVGWDLPSGRFVYWRGTPTSIAYR